MCLNLCPAISASPKWFLSPTDSSRDCFLSSSDVCLPALLFTFWRVFPCSKCIPKLLCCCQPGDVTGTDGALGGETALHPLLRTGELINNTKSKEEKQHEKLLEMEKSMNMVRDVGACLPMVKVQAPIESGPRNTSRASCPSQVRRLYVNCVKPTETSGTTTKTNSRFLLACSDCHKA